MADNLSGVIAKAGQPKEGKAMEPREQDIPGLSADRLEDLHRSLFVPRDENLERVLEIQRERRLLQDRFVDIVVTYGAYEKPI